MVKIFTEQVKVLGLVFLCLINVTAPLLFAWIVEISWKPIADIKLTNGWLQTNPLLIYHLALYLLFFCSFMMSFFVIYSLARYQLGRK